MREVPPRCSIIIVCTNEKHHLAECLPSLRAQTLRDFEVIVVDNASNDGSADWVTSNFPEVRVHRNDANIGFAGATNAGFDNARGDILVSINPDTAADPAWLNELVRELDMYPEVGMVTSRICYFDQRDRVNTCGNEVHLAGFGFCRGLDRPSSEFEQSCPVTSVSGCAFAMRREVFEKIGGLDADYFIYVEETDLSIRAHLAGFQVRYVAGSIIYHKYQLRLRANKFFLLERNRSLTLIKNLRGSTLWLLSPALLAHELLMWLYAFGHGPSYVRAKFRAHAWLIQNRVLVRSKKRQTQALRRVGDRHMLSLLTRRLPVEQLLGGVPGAAVLGEVAGAGYWLLSLAARAFAS